MMRIHVNGQERQFETPMTLTKLVASFQLDPRHVAVEINEQLVPRNRHESTALQDGDRVEIVTLVGGG